MENAVMRDYFRNSNAMVQKLVQSMTKASLASDPADATRKLDHWSNVIRNDYEAKNSLIPHAEEATMLEIVQQQSVLINKLALSNGNLERKMEIASGEIASLREAVESQSTSTVRALTNSPMTALAAWRSGNANETVANASPKEMPASNSIGNYGVGDGPLSLPSTPLNPHLLSHGTPPSHHPLPLQEECLQNESVPDVMATFIGNIQNMLRDAEETEKTSLPSCHGVSSRDPV